jgi:hypothetical protein
MTTVKMSGLGFILKKGKKKHTYDRAWGDNKYRYLIKVIHLDFELDEKIGSHKDSRVRCVHKVRPTRYFLH